jgi:hypothetical protein
MVWARATLIAGNDFGHRLPCRVGVLLGQQNGLRPSSAASLPAGMRFSIRSFLPAGAAFYEPTFIFII